MNKLSTAVKRLAAIKEKGLMTELKKHRAYFYKMYRKGFMSKEEFLKADDSTSYTLAALKE
jgi:hypothetical protein